MDSPVKEKKKHRSHDDKERKRKRYSHASSEETTKKPRIADSPQTLPSSSSVDSSAANSPLHHVTISLFLALSPKYSFSSLKTSRGAETTSDLSPINGVRKHHLDPLLTKYYEPVGGVIVAYRNIKFESPMARIIAECPFAHIWVTVDFLVYKPRRGMVLEGLVRLQSASHIGLLVENTWNVSIPVVKIPDTWKYHDDRGTFVSAYPQAPQAGGEEGGDAMDDTITAEGGWMDDSGDYIDGMLKFQVESVKGGGSIFLVEGSLLNQDTIRQAPSYRANTVKSARR